MPENTAEGCTVWREVEVPNTEGDLIIALVDDGKQQVWWLLGSEREHLCIIDIDISEGLIAALKTWQEMNIA